MKSYLINIFAAVAICLCFGVPLAQAVDQSSANYKNDASTFAPAVFDQASTNYQINGAVDPIVGDSDSSNFNVQHGVPLRDLVVPTPTPTPTPTGGGGGGGGGLLPAVTVTTTNITPSAAINNPTLNYRSPTYLSHQLIGGTMVSSTRMLTVNGSANGVNLLPNSRWNRDFPLFIGYNEIRVQTRDFAGAYSDVMGGIVERMLIGNISRPTDKGSLHTVDDVDLSLFTRAWHKFNFYADFNEDGKIDDADLSLLVSHWGMSVKY